MDNKQNIRTVLRTPLDVENFKTMESFELIVDKGVREAVIAQANSKMQTCMEFKDIFSTAFYMKTENGTFNGPVIKKVRVYRDIKVKKQENGTLKIQDNKRSLLFVKKQNYISKKDYKNYYYAETAKGGNFMVALYRDNEKHAGQRIYDYELISLWQWAEEHRTKDYIPPQKRTDKGEFIGIINPSVCVLFYQNNPDELKTMSAKQLNIRLYTVTEFKKDGRICLRWHRESRAKKDIKESSKIEWESGVPLLCISPSTYQNHTLFEGIDFEISVTGEIIFKE